MGKEKPEVGKVNELDSGHYTLISTEMLRYEALRENQSGMDTGQRGDEGQNKSELMSEWVKNEP